jgi:hypothetical protein
MEKLMTLDRLTAAVFATLATGLSFVFVLVNMPISALLT